METAGMPLGTGPTHGPMETAGGPCHQWTRKESKKNRFGRTVQRKEQYEAMKAAIANWRAIQRFWRVWRKSSDA